MKKALALILGIILIIATVPSISAFADSDPGITNQVITNIFTWNTATPYIDSAGWIYNNYLESATLVSSGNLSHPIPQTVVSLTNPGDYFEVSFDTDIVSSWATSGLFLISIAYDSLTSSGTHYSIPDGAVNCYFCGVEAFYIFQNTMPAADRNWRSLNFIVNSEYLSTTTIRIELDGIPCTFPIAMIRIQQWRQAAINNFTQEQIINMQNNLLTAINVARLADLVGNIDTSDIDLTTLESTTTSILQKLASVPDIIQYIDQIETIDTNILSAINDLIDVLSLNYIYRDLHSFNFVTYDYSVNVNPSTTNPTVHDLYLYLPRNLFDSNGIINIIFDCSNPLDFIEYSFIGVFDSNINNLNYFNNFNFIQVNDLVHVPNKNAANNNTSQYYMFSIPIIHQYSDLNYGGNILIHFHTNNWTAFYYNSFRYSYKPDNESFFDYVKYYLRLLIGNNQSVPSSIDTVNNTVSDQIDDITQFEDIYNQSLNTAASQIDVSSYQITQTSGMSWMRTYTEYNFDQMQNYRILFLTPLILALAAFFLRRKQ